MKILGGRKSLLLSAVCIAVFCSSANAQFESEPISVALDNTKTRCVTDRLVPRNDTYTKGGSSVGYAPPEDRGPGSTSKIDCFISSSEAFKVVFDWKLTQFRPIDRLEFLLIDFSGDKILLSEQKTTTDWATKTFYVPQGNSFIRWVFWDQGGEAWVDNLRISEINALSLALDNLDLDIQTAGINPFGVSTLQKTLGESSVRSGPTADGEQNAIFTTVEGEQRLKFDWRVSSELFFDGLVFFVLDAAGDVVGDPISISGDSDWILETYDITGSGMHTLVWAYVKNGQNESGFDAGWVDNVRLLRLPTQSGWLPAIQDLILTPSP